jgi:hypothetical protein
MHRIAPLSEDHRMSTQQKLRPQIVQVDPRDTVAIIVNQGGLPAGTQFDSGAHSARRRSRSA